MDDDQRDVLSTNRGSSRCKKINIKMNDHKINKDAEDHWKGSSSSSAAADHWKGSSSSSSAADHCKGSPSSSSAEADHWKGSSSSAASARMAKRLVVEDVDKLADDFINKFRNQLKFEREESLKRFREMIDRGL